MYKIDVLLGLQWGDEGKGKFIDVLAFNYDVIARFQGGPNAGHTLEFDGHKYVQHLIPSGIFHQGKINFLGDGMVIDPIAFKEEFTLLTEVISKEVLKKRIVIAERAKLIIPTHRLLDVAYEKARGANKIGSTKKGIGPTYTDHTSRNSLFVGDINIARFTAKYDKLKEKHFQLLASLGYEIDKDALNEEEIKFFEGIVTLRSIEKVNGPYWIDEQLKAGKRILAEGAQGTMLDVDHGNYPFVTSSSTTCGGVCTGLGVAPNRIGKVFGLFKAYCTRVGSGPFPTEFGGKKSEEWCDIKQVSEENEQYPNADINDADPFVQGIALRRKGKEFGATTGRLRRCGWLDITELMYACMINGVSHLLVSKADVLSDVETIKVCTSYNIHGCSTNKMPTEVFESLQTEYTEFPGWGDLATAKTIRELPKTFTEYLNFIEKKTGIPVCFVSTGPDRIQTICE